MTPDPKPAASATRQGAWYVPDLTRVWLEKHQPELVPYAAFINGHMQKAFDKGVQIGEGNARAAASAEPQSGDEIPTGRIAAIEALASEKLTREGVFRFAVYAPDIAAICHELVIRRDADRAIAMRSAEPQSTGSCAFRAAAEIEAQTPITVGALPSDQPMPAPTVPGWYECRRFFDATNACVVRWYDGKEITEHPGDFVMWRNPVTRYTDFRRLVPASAVEELVAENERLRRELESWKYMAVCVHRYCDEHGIPKPPENEPGIPWRVIRLVEEVERLREALNILAAGTDDRLHPPDADLERYFERGLLCQRRDCTDEYVCEMTDAGHKFVRAALHRQPSETGGTG